MKNMRIVILLLFVVSISVYSQEEKTKYQSIGINIFQIPAMTIDFNYDYSVKPFFDLSGDIGYSFNYIYNKDINWIIVPHIKSGNCGIVIKNQTGGFIKTGLKFNLRKSYEKRKFLFLKINLINSIVYEKADFTEYFGYCLEEKPHIIIDDPIKVQNKYIIALGIQIGYSFKISDQLQSDLGLQVALPDNNYKSLFGYRNFIPGIGYKDSDTYWFPILIFNLKYLFK